MNLFCSISRLICIENSCLSAPMCLRTTYLPRVLPRVTKVLEHVAPHFLELRYKHKRNRANFERNETGKSSNIIEKKSMQNEERTVTNKKNTRECGKEKKRYVRREEGTCGKRESDE